VDCRSLLVFTAEREDDRSPPWSENTVLKERKTDSDEDVLNEIALSDILPRSRSAGVCNTAVDLTHR
jgi:hypothetical protein